ncbi:MAG: dTDP-4-dehydrorhamnose 3,5-epimerase [Acetivibrionales bacterium]
MAKFKFSETNLKGVFMIEPEIFKDNRGYFMEVYNYNEFKSAGLTADFVQDNQSYSKKGVLRGLHYQKQYPQCKLVRVIQGRIFDVAVDIRVESPTYKKWFGTVLSSDNRKQIYIPQGFAHGFLVLSEEAIIEYKCSGYYHPEDEGGIIWNDKAIGIEWPLDGIQEVVLSKKDMELNSL